MAFRESIVINVGSFRSMIGSADYLQLPKAHLLSKYAGSRIFKDGEIVDYEAFQKLLLTLLFKHGGNPEKNEFPTTLLVPQSWSNGDIERVTQLMFEKINAPALFLVEEPLAAMYATGSISGLVIDIGHETTYITPIYDNTPIQIGRRTVLVGGKDIDDYFKILKPNDYNESEMMEIKQRAFKVAEDLKSIDQSEHTIIIGNGKSITLGPERYQSCEALFRPELVNKNTGLTIPEACLSAVLEAVEPSKRASLWENIILTGGCAGLDGIQARLALELEKILASSETPNEFQAKEVKYVKIPDYLTVYKQRYGELTYLGGTIVGKIAFSTGGLGYIKKNDYNIHGPSLALRK